MLEIPALSLAILALALLFVGKDLPRLARFALSGLVFGAAMLVKLIAGILLPLAALSILLRSRSKSTAASVGTRNLLVFGVAALVGFAAIALAIDGGAFLRKFSQTWTSHFGRHVLTHYGSATEHPFEWAIFLKNWDVAIFGVAGICILGRGARARRMSLVPLAWLGLVVLVFNLHRPWWPYYYVHISAPLCWCAAVGVASGLAWARRQKETAPKLALGLCVAAATLWMCGRVFVTISDLNKLPRVHSHLVIAELKRYRSVAKYMFTDDLVLSFHSKIPMPPNLAIIPLKRLWAGAITNEKITSELAETQPELIAIKADSTDRPYSDLIAAKYRLVYEDTGHRLFLRRDADVGESGL